MIDIRNLVKMICSKPIAYWFGSTGTIGYEVNSDYLIQKTSNGGNRKLCPIKEIEYWSDDSRMKMVTLGLKSGKRIIVKDTVGKLSLLLSKSPMLAQRRD
jgi:hypothetical protein